MSGPRRRATPSAGPALALAIALLTGCGGGDELAPGPRQATAAEPARADISPAPTTRATPRTGVLAQAPGEAAAADDRRDARPSAPVDPVRQLARELAAVRQELAQLRAQVSTLAARSGLPPDASAAASRHDPVARAEFEAAQRLQDARQEAEFRAEPRHTPDAARLQAQAEQALAAAGLRSQVQRLECSAERCRLELPPADADAARDPRQDPLPMLLSQLAPLLPTAAGAQIDDGDGRQTSVIYLSR